MKFKFDKKAKQFIKNKKIDNIVIQTDNDTKSACCGLGAIDFNVYTNCKEKIKNFKKVKLDNVEIYYEPAMDFYFEENEEILIALIGIFSFKKLAIANEVNILK